MTEEMKVMCVRIPKEEWERLEAIAKVTAKTGEKPNTSIIVREAIRQYFDNYGN